MSNVQKCSTHVMSGQCNIWKAKIPSWLKATPIFIILVKGRLLPQTFIQARGNSLQNGICKKYIAIRVLFSRKVLLNTAATSLVPLPLARLRPYFWLACALVHSLPSGFQFVFRSFHGFYGFHCSYIPVRVSFRILGGLTPPPNPNGFSKVQNLDNWLKMAC